MTHDSPAEHNLEELLDAFRDCGWEAAIDSVAEKGRASILDALREAAEKADRQGSRVQGKVLWLLAATCSMRLDPDKPREPFQPGFVGDGRRSVIPDDFADEEIQFFANIIDEIKDPLLKGRLADLVWLKGVPRQVKFALTAIDSYTKMPLDTRTWFLDGKPCWRRAIGLSRMIGATAGDRIERMESSMLKAIHSSTVEDKFFARRLADTLRADGLGRSHSTIVAKQLEALAVAFESERNFYASESFYSAAAQWFEDSGDVDKSVDMTAAEAEAYVQDASARLASDSPSHGVAASFLEDAIQTYLKIPRIHRDRHNVDQRVKELRLLLNEYGRRAQDEMITVDIPPIDVSGSAQQARDAVRGKPVHEALRMFANLHRTDAAKLREMAIESLSQSSLRAFIPRVVTSPDGRVIHRTAGLSGSAPSDEDEETIRAEMNHPHYGLVVGVAVQGLILPALEVLVLEHGIRTGFFIELARRSPIVPLGREVLFGKALAYGFDREFATSIHLLAPQIEHMVRFHLKSAGVNTTQLDHDGIETEKGLSALIALPETLAIFGNDLTYEISALFCDQVGPNLRNNIAHGLLNDREVQSVDAVYAWWLALKMVFNTFWNSLRVDPLNEEQQPNDSDKH